MSSLTIIIINHNYGRFVGAAIDSAMAQTEGVDRIVVVDDGSTDNSREIISEYGNAVVPVFIPPQGHVAAVNAGFRAAQSDFCIFLDADDLLYPECAAKILTSARPGDAKIQFRLNTIDTHGVDQQMPFPHIGPDLTPAQVLASSVRTGSYPLTVSSGSAFSAAYLQQMLPIDPATIYRSPDGYLSKLAPLYGTVRSLSAILGAYRVHGANAWAQTAGHWDVATTIRWLKFETVLEAAFREHARLRAIPLRTPLEPSFQQIEHRLLALRFAPADTPFTSDTRRNLLQTGLREASRPIRFSLLGRILWVYWLFVLTCAPRNLLHFLLRKTRPQSGRGLGTRWLVAISKSGHTKS